MQGMPEMSDDSILAEAGETEEGMGTIIVYINQKVIRINEVVK